MFSSAPATACQAYARFESDAEPRRSPLADRMTPLTDGVVDRAGSAVSRDVMALVRASSLRVDDGRYGWAIVVSLGTSVTVGYGVLAYAFGVLLIPMEQGTGWSASALTGAYSLAILVSRLAGLKVGHLLDRRSPRMLLTAGSALAAILVFAWSRVSSLFELYLVFAGLGVAMALVLYEAAFVVIVKWFRTRRLSTALTTLTLIAALASFVFSPLTEALVSAYGWRDAVALLALILATTTIPLHAVFLRPTPYVVEARPDARLQTTRAVVRDISFWLIVSSFALSSFVTSAVTVHLVRLLIDGGSGAAFAAFPA